MRPPDLAILCCLTCLPALAQAPPGSEAVGNTDGTLTWSLGDLQPGGSARCVVLFAWDKSFDELVRRLDAARRWAAALPPVAAPAGSGEPVAWIGNDVTDFALDPRGAFFWESTRQALRCDAGGQLSRLGYALFYRAGGAQRAGTSVTDRDGLHNLRVVSPVRPAGPRDMAGSLAT
ncbi:MAG: hypothetical protein HYU66_06640, partial [Armatimonadetes bacterium]|nr:hypothetical protein [Armatimonadota bacterium]